MRGKGGGIGFSDGYVKQARKIGGKDPTHSQKLEASRKAMSIVQARLRNEISEILLPHQVKKIEHLATNQLLERYGLPGLLKSSLALRMLKIDRDQKNRIADRIERETELFALEAKKLKGKFEQNILKELTAAQRKTLGEKTERSLNPM